MYLNDSIIHGLLWEEGAMEQSYEEFFLCQVDNNWEPFLHWSESRITLQTFEKHYIF
jgi:hypothetical protein